ncbi:hypothetical protein [Helicobacter felistomachi]|uniref:hypothetical protein n=1 Tax=Helicobacter felistomachi TaxID=3040201 RepID=UPI002572AAA1|nr:hypothetical protein [Helicobacter sp. NHP21005]
MQAMSVIKAVTLPLIHKTKNIKPQPKLLNEKSTRELGKLIGKLEEQIIKIENEKNTLENSLKKLNDKLNDLKQRQAEASEMLSKKRKQEQQKK